MKAAWLTDIHLNFLSKRERLKFYEEIKNTGAELVLISGDIAEAINVCELLNEMDDQIGENQLIYFIAGNHDYYHGSVDEMRAAFSELKIEYLTKERFGSCIGSDTYLIGVDGWADGFHGDYDKSFVILNDSRLIADLWRAQGVGFSGFTTEAKQKLLMKMRELAKEDAAILTKQLSNIPVSAKKIIVLTHIPPFPENSLYRDQIADENWLPFYTCKSIGDVLIDFAAIHSNIQVLVLCGHSHHKAEHTPLPNLTIKTGAAEYYYPTIQEVFEI